MQRFSVDPFFSLAAEEEDESRDRRQRTETNESRAEGSSLFACELVGNEKSDAGSEERSRPDDEEERRHRQIEPFHHHLLR
jgi:hypothetical protein